MSRQGNVSFAKVPSTGGTNNAGEFIAIVHALAWLTKQGIETPVYSDSKVAIGWIEYGESHSSLRPNESNRQFLDLLERADRWLAENDFSNQVLKWQTKEWGENPADFGRK